MFKRTALIVPALSEQAGQCRIVAANGEFPSPLAAYRRDPRPWEEVGTMDSRGKIVALDPCPHLRRALADAEPCMAGMTVEYSVP